MEQPSSQEQTRARTASVSAAAAIVHSFTAEHPSSTSLLDDTPTTPASPFHLHPWSTERAKVAAESEISPPISPKQHATLGPQADDFLEPLQESNSSFNNSYFHSGSNNSQSTAALTARRLSRTSSSLLHVSNSTSSTLEPVSAAILFSHSTGSPSAVSSSSSSSYSSPSANSSSTSLSSVSLPHQNKNSNSSLSFESLETEEASRLILIDTPPSSHATSPSSESYPTLKGLPASLLSTATTKAIATTTTSTTTTTTLKKKTWAPYHCTSKSVGQIIREISDAVDGRDKTIKVIQYFAKVFLWLFLSNPKQYAVLATRLKALAKQFSNTRKVLRLAHFIDPLASVLTLAVTLKSNVRKHGLRRTLDKEPTQGWNHAVRHRLGHLNTVLGFVQDIADDIYYKAEPWSNRLWMVGVTIDLHENLQTIRDVRKQIKVLEAQMASAAATANNGEKDAEQLKAREAQHVKLTTKLHWLKVTTVKLGGDFLFCGYDNLHCSFSDGFQAVTGFISGLAGAYKYVGKVME
ncbi:Peroxisomal membrane protein PMP27 [Mortierella sp. 14UC]|nr:Peroxisomal membrane protein PMP27 [Mortierella sp. 14UC]